MLRTDLIASVPALLRRQAEARGDQVAYSDAGGEITYGALEAATARLGGHLAARGVGAGDTVALLLPNGIAWIEACFATLRAGAVSVPMSYESSEPEIAYRLQDSGCRLVVTTDEKAELVRRAAAGRPLDLILVDRGGEHTEGTRLADLVENDPDRAAPDPDEIREPSFIIYTSGTTGRAKGVLLSQHAMLWVNAACWAPICGLSADDRVLSPLPLFHSYALNLSVLGILATGASEHLLERFSTAEVLAELGSGRHTLMPGVPTMFHYLLQAAPPEARLAGLRLCVSAGAIMPAALNRAFEARFGVPLLDGYGITETATMVTMNWPIGGRVPGSCGLPVPGLAVRLVDAASGEDVPTGQEGELIVRGPNLMSGYHGKPDETAAALRDGWYRTGDLAKSDPNGFLTITGRLKELIIRGGQNIAPAEIEEAASSFPGVLDCAVVGQPHEHLGEVPVIFVVGKDGLEPDERALLDHLRARLSAYKIPQQVVPVPEIPRTGSGKIMRYRLKQQVG